MTGIYSYSGSLLPSAGTVLLLFILGAYSVYRRKVPGAVMFTFGALFTGLWMFGSLMDRAALDETAKLFWFKFQAGLKLPAITSVFLFVCEYTWPGRWITRRNFTILSIAPAAFLSLLLTDPIHHWLWSGFIFTSSTTGIIAIGSWVFIVYGYVLGIVGIAFFIWLFIRSPQHRWPVAIMLFGQITSRIMYLVEMTHLIDPDIQLDVYTVMLCFSMYAVALFGFRILNPVSLAKQTVIGQMRVGMVVVDQHDVIVSMNPAAETIFNVQERFFLNRPVMALLKSSVKGTLTDPLPGELRIGTGLAARDYLIDCSALKDWRGLDIGRLMLFYDNTDNKHAQAQLNEQQQIRARLQERERMARELHDTLVQTSAAIRMRAEMAGMHLVEGECGKVGESLEDIANYAQQMHMDLREYIFNIRSSVTAEQSFFDTVQDYLAKYSQTWAIETELIVPSNLERVSFETIIDKDQVFCILSEALTNIHKHAGARHARVSFALQEGCLTLMIEDDGCGFDENQLPNNGGFHFGMQSMAERAEALGGKLAIHSEPGVGTEVTITIPMKTVVH